MIIRIKHMKTTIKMSENKTGKKKKQKQKERTSLESINEKR